METSEWFEVYAVIDGALGNTETSYDDPDGVAEAMAKDLRRDGLTDWQVFILPHSCPRTMGGCECVSWLTDHHPTYSSEVK